ncbi:MAG TPA: argininosuccinate lyase [Thermoanaerobaculia bacterium]|nr:argininosuccinate lyase [Thermoanaerobaculia bacterium]
MTNNLWGGRFSDSLTPDFKRLNDSFAYDHRLLAEEIEGSRAWAGALRQVSVLTADEHDRIVAALGEIGTQTPGGSGAWEDVHSFVEDRLLEYVGPIAGKLHTGRSRNDQVATDLRLWLRRTMAVTHEQILDFASSLSRRAEAEAGTPMPGYTHLKQAEAITFGHWCLAWVEMLIRDADRFRAAIDRLDECPLGSGALAGTPLAIDRLSLARALGFSRASANSLDAVSDRDGAVDYLHCAAMLLVHLSRFAEDLIIYSSDELGFVELPDSLATGSSRMPHKKNPDLLELTRGHAGRAIGELTGLLAVIKGLPLAYNKDLQLDKEPLFRTADVLVLVVPLLAAMTDGLILDRVRMRAAASSDLLLATGLADRLAERGIPFRRAHEIVGQRLAVALANGVPLRDVETDDGILPTDFDAADVDRSLAAKPASGGANPRHVAAAAREANDRIAALRLNRSYSTGETA